MVGEWGISPNGKVFDAGNAYRAGFISFTEMFAARTIWNLRVLTN